MLARPRYDGESVTRQVVVHHDPAHRLLDLDHLLRVATGRILPRLAGELESFTRGHAHDLYALRDYQETDTARHVDWKASAKAQQLKVREFTREDQRRVVLVFDRRLPQCDPGSLARFEKAVGLAASLAWRFYEIDAQVEFVTQSFETPAAPAGEIIYPILETLALVEPILLASEVADDLLAHLASEDWGFKVILTDVARSDVPAELWASSHVTFIDSLLWPPRYGRG